MTRPLVLRQNRRREPQVHTLHKVAPDHASAATLATGIASGKRNLNLITIVYLG